MPGCIELPNMCALNRIPGMLLDIMAANNKNIFPQRKRNIIFSVGGGGGGVNCGSGGRGQTNTILLSA